MTSNKHVLDLSLIHIFRRRGAARALLEELLAWGKAMDLAFLTLEVRASNAPAIALYTGLGFQEVGRRRGYYEAPREDALLLTYFY